MVFRKPNLKNSNIKVPANPANLISGYSLSRSLPQAFLLELSDHPITRSPDHPITRSPDHPITRSPDHPIPI
jgi:hypothetical protein